MTTPTKEEIEARALEMWMEDQYKQGVQPTTNPEISELSEGGYLSSAQSLLMTDNARAQTESFFKNPEKPQKLETKLEVRKENYFDILEACDTGFFISGTSQSGKTNLAKLFAKSLIDYGTVVYVIDASRAWNDGPIRNTFRVDRSISAYGLGTSTVYDLSTITLRDKVFFVNEFCKNLYETHVDGYRQKEFVIFEEAQTYIPNGSFRLSIRKNPIYEGAVNLITVGANYGLRFGLITQFPSMVDKTPVKLAMQRYFGWSLEKNDSNYIKAFIGKDWMQELSNLEKGEFVYQNRGKIAKISTSVFGYKTECKNGFTYDFSNSSAPLIQCR